MTLEKNVEKVLAKAEATRETKLLDETAGEHCRTFVITIRHLTGLGR
jgi:hypothetical protein